MRMNTGGYWFVTAIFVSIFFWTSHPFSMKYYDDTLRYLVEEIMFYD